MKSEKISKINRTSIPTPNRTGKNKNIKKIIKNYSRDKNLLNIKFDYSSESKIKTSSIKKLNKFETDLEPESENRKKLNKKIGLIESNQKENIKEKSNKQKKVKAMIKHKTSSTFNSSNNYNIKSPKMFIQNRKLSKTKITNLKITNNNKNQKSFHSYLNKGENLLYQKYNNSYIKTSCFSTKNKIYNCNNIIYQFIENKIYLKNKTKNNSFILKNKNMTLNVGKIFCLTNNNNSAPFIKSKYAKKPKSEKRKNILRHKNTQKLNNSKLIPKSTDNEMSFLSGQKHIFQEKRNLFNKKMKKENINTNASTNDSKSNVSISLFSSYMNSKKKSLYKLKTNDKILTNLKKQNISSYQKKPSVSNISFNKEKERNISFLKVNQEKKKSIAGNEAETEKEKEPKKDCLTTIEEDKKLKKNNCFNFLHHYLLNTVSTKNKIVLKKPEDKTFSNYYQKSEKDRTSKSKSKSKSKSIKTNKRFSLFNRNSALKSLKSDNNAFRNVFATFR